MHAAAAAAGEIDHGFDIARIAAGERQRPPAAGRLADHDHTVTLDEILPQHELDRRRNCIGGGKPGPAIVGAIAAAGGVTGFEIGAAGDPMAGPQRQRDRVTALKEKFGRRRKARDRETSRAARPLASEP